MSTLLVSHVDFVFNVKTIPGMGHIVKYLYKLVHYYIDKHILISIERREEDGKPRKHWLSVRQSSLSQARDATGWRAERSSSMAIPTIDEARWKASRDGKACLSERKNGRVYMNVFVACNRSCYPPLFL